MKLICFWLNIFLPWNIFFNCCVFYWPYCKYPIYNYEWLLLPERPLETPWLTLNIFVTFCPQCLRQMVPLHYSDRFSSVFIIWNVVGIKNLILANRLTSWQLCPYKRCLDFEALFCKRRCAQFIFNETNCRDFI